MKWEYSFEMTSVDFENSPGKTGELLQHGLNLAGKKGWELVSSVVIDGWMLHYYKRPVKEQ